MTSDILEPPARDFYGRPFWWLVFAVVLLSVPLFGVMWRAGMGWREIHPAFNAMLNGTTTIFLLSGAIAIRQKKVEFHRSCMIGAVVTSSAFLVSYLARYATSGSHPYPGHGWDKTVYLVILFSHMVLAVAIVPLVVRALTLAHRKRFDEHKRVVRWLWPAWIYVQFTGIIVYVTLYHLVA